MTTFRIAFYESYLYRLFSNQLVSGLHRIFYQKLICKPLHVWIPWAFFILCFGAWCGYFFMHSTVKTCITNMRVMALRDLVRPLSLLLMILVIEMDHAESFINWKSLNPCWGELFGVRLSPLRLSTYTFEKKLKTFLIFLRKTAKKNKQF
jgi:hypothetical protein